MEGGKGRGVRVGGGGGEGNREVRVFHFPYLTPTLHCVASIFRLIKVN